MPPQQIGAVPSYGLTAYQLDHLRRELYPQPAAYAAAALKLKLPSPPQSDSFAKSVIKGFSGGLITGYVIKPFLWKKNRAQELLSARAAATTPPPRRATLREVMQGAHAVALSSSWELGIPKLASNRLETAAQRYFSPSGAKVAGAVMSGVLTAPIVHVSELWNAQLELLYKTHGKMTIPQLHRHLVKTYGWRAYAVALHATALREAGYCGTIFGTSEIAPHYIPYLPLSNAICSFFAAAATQGVDTYKTRKQQNPFSTLSLRSSLTAPGSQAGLLWRWLIIMGATCSVQGTNHVVDRVM